MGFSVDKMFSSKTALRLEYFTTLNKNIKLSSTLLMSFSFNLYEMYVFVYNSILFSIHGMLEIPEILWPTKFDMSQSILKKTSKTGYEYYKIRIKQFVWTYLSMAAWQLKLLFLFLLQFQSQQIIEERFFHSRCSYSYAAINSLFLHFYKNTHKME